MAEAPRDQNRVPAIIGTSNADGSTPLPVYVDSSTNRLLISGTSSISSEYTEGDTDATITGIAVMAEAAADTLQPLSVDASNYLNVNVAAGSLTVDSEFPAAAAASDNFANPTTTNVMAMGMLWDGSAWDRMLGNSTDGVTVNLGSNNDVTNTTLSVTGGGAEATALRVTLANDSTGVVSVDGGANGIEVVQDTASDLNVTEASAASSLTALQLIDNTVAVLGTATYSEGTTSGNVIGAVRNDTLATLADTDNEIAPLQVNAKGGVWVNHEVGTIGIADDQSNNASVYAENGNIIYQPSMPLWFDGSTWDRARGNSTNGLQVYSGTAAGDLGKAEDAQHASGDTGVAVWAVRDDDPVAATSGTAGDYEPFHTDGRGVLWTRSVPDTTDLANLSGEHVKKYYTSAGAATDGVIWSPAAGKRWYVTDIFINISAAATVTLEDDKTGGDDPVWKAELAANSGWSHSFTTPLFSGEDAADLTITTSAGNVYVMVTGYEI
jgi:hypothetical protein